VRAHARRRSVFCVFSVRAALVVSAGLAASTSGELQPSRRSLAALPTRLTLSALVCGFGQPQGLARCLPARQNWWSSSDCILAMLLQKPADLYITSSTAGLLCFEKPVAAIRSPAPGRRCWRVCAVLAVRALYGALAGFNTRQTNPIHKAGMYRAYLAWMRSC
jgi:hypothetical protein